MALPNLTLAEVTMSYEREAVSWSAEAGIRLKQARLRAEKSQQALADELNVSQPTISNWERGSFGPNEGELQRIETYLGRMIVDAPAPAESELSDLGLWLRQQVDLKKSTGKTISTVAEEVDVSIPTLYNIMNGSVAAPQTRTLKKLQDYFGQPPAEVREEAEAARDVGTLGQFSQFVPHDQTQWPTGPGVYILYDLLWRPTYIGKSNSSVASRLRDHQTRFWFKHPLVVHGAYVAVTEPGLVRDIENLLIKVVGSLAVINQQGVIRDS